jgi:hypothetical protein
MTEEEKLKILDETNLLRLFLSGFTLNAKVDCSGANKHVLRKMLVSSMRGIEYAPKSIRFSFLAFNSCVFKMKLSQAKTFNMVMEFLNQVNPDIPDGADLVDELGTFIDRIDGFNAYSGFPPFRNLVDTVKEHGLCEVEGGLVNPVLNLALKVQTEGIKELIDLVLGGMVDR